MIGPARSKTPFFCPGDRRGAGKQRRAVGGGDARRAASPSPLYSFSLESIACCGVPYTPRQDVCVCVCAFISHKKTMTDTLGARGSFLTLSLFLFSVPLSSFGFSPVFWGQQSKAKQQQQQHNTYSVGRPLLVLVWCVVGEKGRALPLWGGRDDTNLGARALQRRAFLAISGQRAAASCRVVGANHHQIKRQGQQDTPQSI